MYFIEASDVDSTTKAYVLGAEGEDIFLSESTLGIACCCSQSGRKQRRNHKRKDLQRFHNNLSRASLETI